MQLISSEFFYVYIFVDRENAPVSFTIKTFLQTCSDDCV